MHTFCNDCCGIRYCFTSSWDVLGTGHAVNMQASWRAVLLVLQRDAVTVEWTKSFTRLNIFNLTDRFMQDYSSDLVDNVAKVSMIACVSVIRDSLSGAV